jgi:hypothetical protein
MKVDELPDLLHKHDNINFDSKLNLNTKDENYEERSLKKNIENNGIFF